MNRTIWRALAIGALLAGAACSRSATDTESAPFASQESAADPSDALRTSATGPVDVILTGGKVITVDEKFTIAQAIAVTGERIVAVGSNDDISSLAGPATRRIDLAGRAVVPGMIDNHAHYMEEGVLWTDELRLDNVTTRAQAIEMMKAKAASLPPERWVYTLGGWSPDQFTDDTKSFSRAELDQIVSTHPLLLQFTRGETYVNSKGIEVLGLEARMEPWNTRDASGRSIGVIDALAPGGFAAGNEMTAKIPRPTLQDVERNGMAMIKELNAVGLTASSGTCPDEFVPIFRGWAREGRLNKRFFCIVAANTGADANAVSKALPEIERMKLFQGDNWVDHIAYGEGLYGPAGDSMVAPKGTQPQEAFEQWGRIAREVARAGMPLHSHTTLEHTFNGFLDQIEKINGEFPVRNLHWALIHDEQVTAEHLERMKNLGLYAAIQPRATIMGGIYHRQHGDRAFTMPDFRLIQDSGIVWGLGTDAFEVNQYNPFVTLAYAVTGKMVGGTVTNRATVGREDALIAHTRKNAIIIMQENNLGSIAPGKLADLLVLDRDYLTIPADEIKDIRPAMTMVGGRVVYDAAAPATTTAAR
jgi:predicted amidohydrolase YtcJ